MSQQVSCRKCPYKQVSGQKVSGQTSVQLNKYLVEQVSSQTSILLNKYLAEQVPA
jgi:hypothetical protein